MNENEMPAQADWDTMITPTIGMATCAALNAAADRVLQGRSTGAPPCIMNAKQKARWIKRNKQRGGK